ncbi:MAG: HAMP domain-containing sensor histidine kinase [Parafilimonas sp.]
MVPPWINGKSFFFISASCIVTGTIFYSQYLAKKIALDEKKKVELWVEAQKTIINTNDQTSFNLAAKISSENKDIPIIETNEQDSITSNYLNLDTNKIKSNPSYLQSKLAEFKKQHKPIILVLSETPYQFNKYYYGNSMLQQEVLYYPIVQLIIAGLFLIVIISAQRTAYISTQNQLWAGMAKETAHQLGTPVSSLKGWIEVLKEIKGTEKISNEIDRDIVRLELITDRFGKIGSRPQLEETNLVKQVKNMVDYMKKRAGGKVEFTITRDDNENNISAMISPPLFDWVIENLIKNSLDAMEGNGRITIYIHDTTTKVMIDITDTGKGISKPNKKKVFNPGFTTKKRGWGLGLTLSKRIIEQYHKGVLSVQASEPGKRTTFRIELNKG